MDIKKFTESKLHEEYNVIIKNENHDVNNKSKSTEYSSLYKVSSLDFIKLTESIDTINNDPNIDDFTTNICSDKSYLVHIGFSGPMIKKYLNPMKTELPIKNYYIVTNYNEKIKSLDIINDTYQKNMTIENGYYIIRTEKTTYYIEKKSYKNLSNSVLSRTDTLNRIILAEDELWVSGLFILDLYKKITYYDEEIKDPVFSYPEDILDIYEKNPPKVSTLKDIIDVISFDKIQTIKKEEIETTLILHNNQRLTVIEYVLMKLLETQHPILVYQLKNIFLYLIGYTYYRPPFFVAKLYKIDEQYPAVYDIITELKHKIDIDPSIDISSLESVYHIDMYILNHLIKKDDVNLFMNYITVMGILNKFKTESKTTTKLINWMIELPSQKIITTLIEKNYLSNSNKFKLILNTQEIKLLGDDFIKNYIITKINTEINTDNTDNTDNIDNKEIKEQKELDDEMKECILKSLGDIINKGLTRSFMVVLKLCPEILNEDFDIESIIESKNESKNEGNNNILNLITNDSAHEILEIILKNNKKLIDTKNNNGETALIRYANLGLTNCMMKLLDNGSDYELTDNNNETFLHKLCKNGNYETVQTVVRKVIDIIDSQNDKLMTPAMISALHGHEEIFYILRGLNANLDQTDIYGNNVYHYICKSKICPGIIIPNKKNKFGFTPYDYCSIDHKFYFFQN